MVTRTDFDTLPDGSAAECYVLQNAAGMTVRLLNIGAAIQSVLLPDADGNPVPVALSYDTADAYLHTPTFAGAICGRVANRIGGAAFTLHGKTYNLPANDGENQLHGGPGGFHQRIWDAELMESGVRFSLESCDGDQGFPGNLRVSVTYTLSEDNVLALDYEANSDQDTLCNLTNHTYWNLAGPGGDPLMQKVRIMADFFTPIDKQTLPTGAIAPVRGPFDLRKGKFIALGKQSKDPQVVLVNGYDHNFVLRNYEPGELRYAASLSHLQSGRALDIYTIMPGIQFFSGMVTPRGHTGVALETQYFPDAMRHRWFPSIVLNRDTLWCSRTEYRFQWNGA